MFDWLRHLWQPPADHEPSNEVRKARIEQRRRFDDWEAAQSEVRRVERIAESVHPHRPHRRPERHA